MHDNEYTPLPRPSRPRGYKCAEYKSVYETGELSTSGYKVYICEGRKEGRKEKKREEEEGGTYVT